jgi:rubrerythrin
MKFTSREIIDIAVEIEESGYQFYTGCSSKFTEKNLTTLFTYLAGEELRHKEIFQKLLEVIKDQKGIFTEDYYRYIEAIGNERIFSKGKSVQAIVSGLDSPLKAFDMALNAEKDSILFYNEIAAIYNKNTEAYNLLNNIINEERKHIITILDIKKDLGVS